MTKEKIKLSIEVELIREDEWFIIHSTNEFEEILGQHAYSQDKSLEEAEKSFWNMIKFTNKFHEQRSKELDKYKFFQKGNWSHIGGTWFTVLGINIYFRYGSNMKYGWYIPFTKLNISVNNAWRKKKENMKYIIILFSLLLLGCEDRREIVIEGCQYIESTTYTGQSYNKSLTHKGNCNNPIHKKQ